MPPSWIRDASFYHIYPLGLCGAPKINDYTVAPAPRLDHLYPWINHICSLNLNAVYLGPVFESTAHGYDTKDYYQVDRRLGDNATLKCLIQTMKQTGLRVILDGVFNHVGRDFFAFRDVQAFGSQSRYADWFHGIDFGRRSPYGDMFSYEGWAGHYDLVKLNLSNAAVREHLFGAVTLWITEFGIDGLRLDAADQLDPGFMKALAAHCRSLKADFWLMGEVVHGDYRHWANTDMLDSTTNYECYKGLYSSHNDQNYFEIAYSLNRLFGEAGIYRDLVLYTFADNHDVNRIGSMLRDPAHLYPQHILLFTMPGIPSIYYGSEWGIPGLRTASSDHALRPALDLETAPALGKTPELFHTIRDLLRLRQKLPALRYGDYQQLYVNHRQFAFARRTDDQTVIVAVNASEQPVTLPLRGLPDGACLHDVLNANRMFPIHSQGADVLLYPNWGGIFVVE